MAALIREFGPRGERLAEEEQTPAKPSRSTLAASRARRSATIEVTDPSLPTRTYQGMTVESYPTLTLRSDPGMTLPADPGMTLPADLAMTLEPDNIESDHEE